MNGVSFFAWDLDVIFFRHTNFWRFKISNFFFNLDFGCHRKMYWLVPCVPIFRGCFWLKIPKRCVYVNMLFLVLILVKNVFLGLKKGINDLLHQVAPKHTAVLLNIINWMGTYARKRLKATSKRANSQI